MSDPALVPTREVVEQLIAAEDWMEIYTVLNLLVEPLVGDLMTTQFLGRSAARNGDPVTPMVVAGARRNADRHLASAKALLTMLLTDSEHGASNRHIVSGWMDAWAPRVDAAAVALSAVFTLPGVRAPDPAEALASVRARSASIRAELEI
jgi:hypothetical protein